MGILGEGRGGGNGFSWEKRPGDLAKGRLEGNGGVEEIYGGGWGGVRGLAKYL